MLIYSEVYVYTRGYQKFVDWLFVCLFGVYCPIREFFTIEYVDVTVTDEGLQILTFARHSWPLSSEGSTCHTNCDTGLPLNNDPWHSHLINAIKSIHFVSTVKQQTFYKLWKLNLTILIINYKHFIIKWYMQSPGAVAVEFRDVPQRHCFSMLHSIL